MKLLTVALLALAFAGPVIGAESENSLRVWVSLHQGLSSTGHPPFCVTAYLKRAGDRPLAAFKLTNLSTNPLTLYRSDLPWGNPHSLRLAAVTTDGELVPNLYPISDPGPGEVTIAPSQSMEGDHDLSRIVQFRRAPKGKDVVVIWSYLPIGNVTSPKATCTGVLIVTNSP